MPHKGQIEITQEDLKFILGDNYPSFEEKIIPGCFCGQCHTAYQSKIINYKFFLNDLNDIILRGFCEKCGNRINRYVETGEIEEYQEKIEKVRRRYTDN